MQLSETPPDFPIYFIMSDQPDTCGYCGSRLELLAIKELEGERILLMNALAVSEKY